MKRLLFMALALAFLGCKKSGQAAAKPAEPAQPAPNNAATQYVQGLQDSQKRAQDVQRKANASIGQTSQALGEATGETASETPAQ